MNAKVLHIVSSDKFTIEYIKYMVLKMKKFNHLFLVNKSNYINDINAFDSNIREYVKLVNDKECIFKQKEILNDSDVIIVSGIFDIERYMFFLPNRILKKMYLQFWGGDFYPFKNIKFFSKMKIRKIMLHSCIKRCAGIINLIDGDYEELCKIFPNKNNHYVMILPSIVKRMDILEKYSSIRGCHGKILLGNSATAGNCHIEILEKIRHLKNDDIQIICPLSYGDKEYREKVIKIGQEIYGDKFVPILDYMSYDDYLSLISTCSVAIFNNNRQQALGNISMMVALGKKVYIRKNTPMWKEFTKYNIRLYDVEDLKNVSYDDLFNLSDDVVMNNKQNIRQREIEIYESIDCFFDKILLK